MQTTYIYNSLMILAAYFSTSEKPCTIEEVDVLLTYSSMVDRAYFRSAVEPAKNWETLSYEEWSVYAAMESNYYYGDITK